MKRPPAVDRDLRRYVSSHGSQTPTRIVLHSTESGDAASVTDIVGVALYWQTQGKGYGAHLGIDKDGFTGRYVDDGQVAWHTGGMNTGSLGVELVGFSRFTLAGWYGRPRQLQKLARWLVWWSREHRIPLQLAGWTNGSFGPGVLTHALASAHYAASQGHTDPGRGFPLRFVLALARTYDRYGR